MKVDRKFSVEEFIKSAKKSGVFAFDIEHSPDFDCNDVSFVDNIWGVGLATFQSDEVILAVFQRDLSIVKTIMSELSECEAVAYNGKYDIKCLTVAGVLNKHEYPKKLCDPMVAVNLLDDNRRPNSIGLKSVILDYYKYEMKHFKDVAKTGPDSEEFCKYAVDDVVWELILWRDLKPKLVAQKVDKLFYKILMPVSNVFADMELSGMRWDMRKAKDLLLMFAEKRECLVGEITTEIGDLNLNSGDQIARRLFDELNYSTRGIEMTKSGTRYATDVSAMEILAKRYPVCDKIVKYRMCEKMIGTYIEPLTRRALKDPTSRIHPTFWIVSSTGRTRCESPNLQNLPANLSGDFAGMSIRNCFVPSAGRSLVVADLSQIELRVAAHISQDTKFVSAFTGWACKKCNTVGNESNMLLHTCPNCGTFEEEKTGFWHGLDLHALTAKNVPALKGDRQAGKQANFALIYMATARRMAETYPDMSVPEWEEAIDQYMVTYSGIKKWHLQCQNMLKSGGIAVDIFGRKRRIPQKDVKDNFKHSLNQFVNFPVQSSACAYIELALINLRASFLENKTWLNGVWPVNFVHDEIVLEVEDSLVSEVVSTTTQKLENATTMRVPVRVSIKVVKSWGDAK